MSSFFPLSLSLLIVCVCSVLVGCASKKTSDSEQFRVQTLEEKALDMQSKQKSQEERLLALEHKLVLADQHSTQPGMSGMSSPGMSSKDMQHAQAPMTTSDTMAPLLSSDDMPHPPQPERTSQKLYSPGPGMSSASDTAYAVSPDMMSPEMLHSKRTHPKSPKHSMDSYSTPPRQGGIPAAPVPAVSSDMPYKRPMAVQPVPPSSPMPRTEHRMDGMSWDDYPETMPSGNMSPQAMTATTMHSMADKKMGMNSNAATMTYKKALDLILKGNTSSGRKAMAGFLKAHPTSSLVPNAQYWLAECDYSDKKFADAILKFRMVQQQHPKHAKAAAALLKIGYSYHLMGDKENARFYLGILLQDYPKSEAAPLARKRLKML